MGAEAWLASGKIGLAVSGGPDSVALLLLAHAAFLGQIEVATVDHRLRPESEAEAELVAAICAARGIPHVILPVDVASGNVQSEARRARYAALQGWLSARGLSALFTAHHQDDQAETLLMRLGRGSGVRGLAGVRASTTVPGGHYPLLRPLLGWRREELAAVVAACGVTPVDDPSNHDLRFDRVRLRQSMADAPWLDVAGIARSAAWLAQADDALGWAVQREWDEHVMPDGNGGYCYTAVRGKESPPELIRAGVLERAARVFGGALDASEAARMAARLAQGEPCNFGGMAGKPSGGSGEQRWTLNPENPRRSG